MKVLQILPTIDKSFGGPIVVAEQIAIEFKKKNIQVDIFPFNLKVNLITRIFMLFKLVPKYDLIHIHCIWSLQNTIASIIARIFKIPYILTPHGMLDKWSLKQKKIKKYVYFVLVEKFNLKNAKYIHFLNSDEYIESKNLYNFKKYIIIPNGANIQTKKVNDSNLRPLIDELIKNKKIILLYLGRLHPKKGLDDLMKSFSLVIKKNSKFHLIIAGGGEEFYSKKLKELMNGLLIKNNVSFIGPIYGEDKLFLYEQSDIFILPSYQEGDSVAIKEAMSYHLPVIITNACHFDEVEFQKAGKIISNEISQITDSILFFSEESVRELYGLNGYNLISKKYTWQMVSKEYYKLYNNLILNE
jgi:glycosyltransferase involved in cell wall biosynthesis